MLVGFLCRLLGNRVCPVKGVRSRCNALEFKRCYGKSNVKVRMYTMLFYIYLLHVTIQFNRKEHNGLQIIVQQIPRLTWKWGSKFFCSLILVAQALPVKNLTDATLASLSILRYSRWGEGG